jgi:hypothetical protein
MRAPPVSRHCAAHPESPLSEEAMSDTDMSNTPNLSASALWALERLADVRYGRDAPALGWSIARELVSAGFVSHPVHGRSGASITAEGRTFLKSRK